MKKVLIIYHRVDYDGVFSGCTAKEFYSLDPANEVKMLGWNYNDPIDQVTQGIDWATDIVMVDISFPIELMQNLRNIRNKEVIWIDHHITAINDSIKFHYSDLKGIRLTEMAASELTWRFFFNDQIPKLIQYVAAYDIWNKDKFNWEEETYPIQLGLKANYGVSEKGISSIWNEVLTDNPDLIEDILYDGRLIYKYQRRVWKSNCKNYAFPVTVAGKYKGVAIINTEFGSNQFSPILEDYDIYIVVNRRGSDCFNISMYKEPDRLPEFSLGGYTTKLGNTMLGHLCATGSQLTLKQFEQFIETCEI